MSGKKINPAPYLFLAPAVLIFGLFVAVPVLGTFLLAFTDWSWPQPMRWCGLANFTALLRDDFIFHRALANNFIYLFLSMIFEISTALALALLLARRFPGRGAFRILFFTPMVLPLVLVGFLFRFILRADGGLFNAALASLGLPGEVDWLVDRRFALAAISMVSGWIYCGFFLVLIQAGLGRIPRELLEAARLETDSAWKRFVHVTLPLLREVLVVCVLLCATGAFKAFDLFYVLGGRSGGPGHITEIVPTWLVQQAFELKHYGYGCAMALALTIIVGAIAGVYVKIAMGRKKEAPHLEF
ncbi:MAG: sugar ABC transporter permease [Planctomycetes bacterium]|nr:sugar ABC transporter permease [Planctomycetota bacterium]